jgi:hypothetical protein
MPSWGQQKRKVSKKPGSRKQHDLAYAEEVQVELDGPLPDLLDQRVVSAVRCATLAVLARPEVHRRLVRRLRALLEPSLPRASIRDICSAVSRARTLAYESGQETHLTVSEAARRLGVARSTVYRWLGDPETFLSPMHDDPELGPDRVPIATVNQMKRSVAEKTEIDQLREYLEADLPNYEQRVHLKLMQRLESLDGPLIVREIHRVALDENIPVSEATVRRTQAVRVDRSRRGRPRKIYGPEAVSRLLARQARRQRAKLIHSASTPLQTLRRLSTEIPAPAVPSDDMP